METCLTALCATISTNMHACSTFAAEVAPHDTKEKETPPPIVRPRMATQSVGLTPSGTRPARTQTAQTKLDASLVWSLPSKVRSTQLTTSSSMFALPVKDKSLCVCVYRLGSLP